MWQPPFRWRPARNLVPENSWRKILPTQLHFTWCQRLDKPHALAKPSETHKNFGNLEARMVLRKFARLPQGTAEQSVQAREQNWLRSCQATFLGKNFVFLNPDSWIRGSLRASSRCARISQRRRLSTTSGLTSYSSMTNWKRRFSILTTSKRPIRGAEPTAFPASYPSCPLQSLTRESNFFRLRTLKAGLIYNSLLSQ